MEYTIFFDDGGVLNDNNTRGKQWQKHCGDFFHSRFGGDPKQWGEANYRLISYLIDRFFTDSKHIYGDYTTFYTKYKKDWVIAMFTEVGKSPPPETELIGIFDDAVDYVIPKVDSAIPGIIESIKKLHLKGFTLYTAAGPVSKEIKLYLEGMGVKHYFSGFYGPDIVCTWKSNPNYFQMVLDHASVNPEKAIIIEDRPVFIEYALKTKATVIQACITGEYDPQFPNYIQDMHELPDYIEKLIRS